MWDTKWDTNYIDWGEVKIVEESRTRMISNHPSAGLLWI